MFYWIIYSFILKFSAFYAVYAVWYVMGSKVVEWKWNIWLHREQKSGNEDIANLICVIIRITHKKVSKTIKDLTPKRWMLAIKKTNEWTNVVKNHAWYVQSRYHNSNHTFELKLSLLVNAVEFSRRNTRHPSMIYGACFESKENQNIVWKVWT